MSDEREALIGKITHDLVDVITTHVKREMETASDQELAAFQTFVAKEVEAAKTPIDQGGESALLDLVMQKARAYKKK